VLNAVPLASRAFAVADRAEDWITINNPSCPLEVIVTAETLRKYKEGYFQLEPLGRNYMDGFR